MKHMSSDDSRYFAPELWRTVPSQQNPQHTTGNPFSRVHSTETQSQWCVVVKVSEDERKVISAPNSPSIGAYKARNCEMTARAWRIDYPYRIVDLSMSYLPFKYDFDWPYKTAIAIFHRWLWVVDSNDAMLWLRSGYDELRQWSLSSESRRNDVAQ